MCNLAFVRLEGAIDCWDYFESKVEVWVLGDRKGLLFLAGQLLKAACAEEAISLDLLRKHENSMKGVILPARKGSSKAKLKIIERLVSADGRVNMELVVFGNVAGYKYLSEELNYLCRKKHSDISDHIHVDDVLGSVLVPRSVSLSLRAPVRKWSKKDWGEYASLVFSRQKTFLPRHVHTLETTGEYEAISAEKSDFLKF